MPPFPPPLCCVVDAPAKLNLCLEVLGKGDDGFHQLRTLMATVRLRDTLRLQRTPDNPALQLRLHGDPRLTAGVPTDGSNLALRAIERLREEAGMAGGFALDLVKRIPHQAGLGGGSSDAAAALVAAARLGELGWSTERLSRLGAELGSDIPYFVHAIADRGSRVAVASGRGERIAPVSSPAGVPVVIAKPPQGLGTAAVYGQCRESDYTPVGGVDRTAETARLIARGLWRRLAGVMTNALQAAAMRLAPWLETIAKRFDECGCIGHQLSGSGSAYFGLTRTMSEARRVAARLRAHRIGQVLVTTIG